MQEVQVWVWSFALFTDTDLWDQPAWGRQATVDPLEEEEEMILCQSEAASM